MHRDGQAIPAEALTRDVRQAGAVTVTLRMHHKRNTYQRIAAAIGSG
ncbi:MAG: hypothetical protein ACLPVY_10980 [Acidimicrobiia bacterium]